MKLDRHGMIAIIAAVALLCAGGMVISTSSALLAYQGPPSGEPGFAGGQGGPGGGPGVFRGRGGRGPGQIGHALLGRLGDRIGLTEEQQSQIEALLESTKSASEADREELRTISQSLRDLNENGGFFANEAEITDLVGRQAQVQAGLHLAGMRLTAEIFEILTPEQREELASMRGRRGRGHRGGNDSEN